MATLGVRSPPREQRRRGRRRRARRWGLCTMAIVHRQWRYPNSIPCACPDERWRSPPSDPARLALSAETPTEAPSTDRVRATGASRHVDATDPGSCDNAQARPQGTARTASRANQTSDLLGARQAHRRAQCPRRSCLSRFDTLSDRRAAAVPAVELRCGAVHGARLVGDRARRGVDDVRSRHGTISRACSRAC